MVDSHRWVVLLVLTLVSSPWQQGDEICARVMRGPTLTACARWCTRLSRAREGSRKAVEAVIIVDVLGQIVRVQQKTGAA